MGRRLTWISRDAGTRLTRVVALTAFILAGCSKDVPELVREAGAYRAKGNNVAAVIQLKNALKQAPGDREAHFLIASVYLDMGSVLEAEREFRVASKLGVEWATLLPGLGSALLEMERFQQVLDEIRVEDDFSPGSAARIALLRGRAHLGLGNFAGARNEFSLALPAMPGEAKLGLAEAAVAEGNASAAESLTDEVLAATPSSAEAWLMKGNLLRARSQSDEALATFAKSLALKPSFVPALLSRASHHLNAGNLVAARKEVDAARKFAPGSVRVRFASAVLALYEKRYEVCHEDLREVFRVIPGHAPGVLLSGALFFSLGALEQAQVALVTFLKRSPGNVYGRKLLAATLLKKAQPESAAYVLEPLFAHVQNDVELYALAGQAYMQSGNLAKAREFLEKAVAIDPRDAKIRTSLGLTRLAAGDIDRAVGDLESAVALNPSDTTPESYLVSVLIAQNAIDKALQVAHSLEKKQPNNPLTHQLKGAAYLARQDAVSARMSFERALRIQPTFYPAVAAIAQMDLRANNPKAARDRLEAFLKKDRRNLDAMLALARLDLAVGQAATAIGTLRGAVEEHPQALEAHLLLAQTRLQVGLPQDALAAAEKGLQISPGDARAMDLIGRAQLATGDARAAINSFSGVVESAPKSVPALLNLASAYSANREFRKAIGTIQRAIDLKPDDIDAKATLGVTYLSAGRFRDAADLARRMQKDHPRLAHGHALEGDALMGQAEYAAAAQAFEKADAITATGLIRTKLHQAQSLALKRMASDERLLAWLKEHPDDSETRLYLADAYLNAGQRKAAIEQYLAVLRARPKHARALNNLASLLHEEGDARALQYAQEAFQAEQSGFAADTLGWILIQRGMFDEGLLMLSRAVTLQPDIPEIRYHFAQALFRAGNRAEARRELKTALKSGRAFKGADEARALLEELSRPSE